MAMSRLGQLELIASRIVEGFLSGKHRSPYKGSSVEFAEHRHYSPGDETRLIDWRVLARSDRCYIKQFEEETNLKCLLVLDASGSMGFGHSTVTKLRYAQMASACLARMMLHQQDAVGLAVVDGSLRTFIPPRSRASHFRVLVEALRSVVAVGPTSLAGELRELGKRLRRRGMIFVLSDCFDDVEGTLNALHHLRLRGHETILFHTMAPEELSFAFSRWSRFECLETAGHRIDLDPSAIRKEYLRRVGEFLGRLEAGCGEIGCDYMPLETSRPLAEVLGHYLSRRAARVR
ncbi:MAG: DUF58 domain-containing protein [Phycisphaerae bacterium]|nr:DUF58 domain-containing protein [Phycisphaerae bacterium]